MCGPTKHKSEEYKEKHFHGKIKCNERHCAAINQTGNSFEKLGATATWTVLLNFYAKHRPLKNRSTAMNGIRPEAADIEK